MKNVAIITARGGSKRIPRKNIKSFRGKPIIAYSIETALASGLFDLVMVSTDDDEIADVALKLGAEVPFKRSAKNADDFSGTADVIVEVLSELSGLGKVYTNACCIYPTAPFISCDTLTSSFELLKNKKFDSVFPVCSFSYPIRRGLEFINDNQVAMMWPENELKRSQDLKASYHDAGQFYWLHIEKFLYEKKIFTANTGAIVLDELHVQDIDNETDWKIAELKHSLLYP